MLSNYFLQMADGESEKELDAEVPAETETPLKSDEQQPSKSENVTYEEGEAFYTDEATKYKYKWCKETNQWKPMENEHYKWCGETQKWIPKIPLENEYYRWCDRTNQWIPKMKRGLEEDTDGVYGYDEKEKCQTYTDKDGVVFLWVSNSLLVVFPRVKN
jgi:HIV Tat-specific factor 1